MRSPKFRSFAGGMLALALLCLILMALRPGHWGYADSDGCACVVSYTSADAKPACEATRSVICDGFGLNYLLVLASRFDLSR